jgi:hypothetical protein
MSPEATLKHIAALDRLRKDAMDREMPDLAIVYGWSILRLGNEVIASAVKRLSWPRL